MTAPEIALYSLSAVLLVAGLLRIRYERRNRGNTKGSDEAHLRAVMARQQKERETQNRGY